MFVIKKVLNILVIIWKEFFRCDCLNKAASLSYTTLLSLVPLLTVSFSALTFFPVFDKLKLNIQNIIIDNFVTASAQSIQQYLHMFINQADKLSVIGMGFLLVTAILLILSMEKIFNTIWRVKINRHGIMAFFIYWFAIILIPVVIALVMFGINYILSMPWIVAYKSTYVIPFFTFTVPHVGFFVAVFLLYISLPNCKVPVFSALFSALIATILFELARNGFVLYIKYLSDYQLIYGAAASVPIFLIWIYLSWLLILFGVVINYVLANLHKLELDSLSLKDKNNK